MGEGREAEEGRDICKIMADSHCMAKTTQHCKAIILQLKKFFIDFMYVPELHFW